MYLTCSLKAWNTCRVSLKVERILGVYKLLLGDEVYGSILCTMMKLMRLAGRVEIGSITFNVHTVQFTNYRKVTHV